MRQQDDHIIQLLVRSPDMKLPCSVVEHVTKVYIFGSRKVIIYLLSLEAFSTILNKNEHTTICHEQPKNDISYKIYLGEMLQNDRKQSITIFSPI